jgi:hypothetical protein
LVRKVTTMWRPRIEPICTARPALRGRVPNRDALTE